MRDTGEYTCVTCGGTFALNPEFDAAAEYEARFGAAPRSDSMVCDDCYRQMLVAFGHCADCLDKPCTCQRIAQPQTTPTESSE